jgi:hypothetical protein
MRVRFILVAALISGCSERALDHCVAEVEDFASVRDLAVSDFSTTTPPDRLFDLSHQPEDPCPAGARFIFTIETNGLLSRWNPNTKQFFPTKPILCPGSMGGPNSMAIDHNGNGWVNFNSGQLFFLDTTTITCSPTPLDPTGNPDFQSWGMSFAQDVAGNFKQETLFIADQRNGLASLGTVDLQKFVATTQAVLGINGHPELTGDNKAQLWGFFPDTMTPQVGRIDKMTGQVDMIFPLPQLAGSPNDWAFAAWDGDFYIFLLRNGDPSTNIYRLHSADGSLETVIQNSGHTILGVGVATCAGNPVPDQ